jgi:hypothetical protein
MPVVLPTCAKCDGEMEVGYIPDYIPGGIKPSFWAKGLPKKSFWTGITEPDRLTPIITFRCINCDYLELYAWCTSTK